MRRVSLAIRALWAQTDQSLSRPVLLRSPQTLGPALPRHGKASASTTGPSNPLDGMTVYLGDCLFFSASRNASVLT
jgi:hypothetical protein